MAIFGAIIIVLNFITFASTRERVQPLPGQKSSLKEDLKNVFSCGPWIVMFVLTLLIFTMLVVRGSSSNYFFAYYLDPQRLRGFLDKTRTGRYYRACDELAIVLNSLGLLVNPDGSNAAAVD
jgi:hypothetical protein